MKKFALSIAISIFAFCGNANATLMGDDVDVSWLFPDSSTAFATDTHTVGAGVEIDCPTTGSGSSNICSGFASSPASIDIGGDFITYNQTSSPGFTSSSYNGFLFEDLADTIIGFTLETNMAGLLDSAVAFGDHWISINLAGLGGENRVDFFNITLKTAGVPAPASLALLGLGLVGLGFSRRKS